MFLPLDLKTFHERTGIDSDVFARPWHEAARIVALRDIVEVLDLRPMPIAYLERLIRNVGLEGDSEARPFRECEIRQERIEPVGLMIGQTFIERAKYRAILENFSGIFAGFSAPRGISKLTAYVVFGRLADGTRAIAQYLPPIVEEHDGRRILLDGIHRNFVVKNAGTTIESIVIRGVPVPFPCEPQAWDAITAVDEKPPKEARFFGLRRDLFRDVKRIGIDG